MECNKNDDMKMEEWEGRSEAKGERDGNDERKDGVECDVGAVEKELNKESMGKAEEWERGGWGGRNEE